MIPPNSVTEAISLSNQGWSATAIARHLGHGHTTIRNYLTGRRTPGQPRQQAHAFAPFADYAARRALDDPHLLATWLHRELADLGYPGDHDALDRQLRSSGIIRVCPACRQRLRTSVSPAPDRHHPQPLPIRVAPIAGQTIASYLNRLTAANHLPARLVLAHLPSWFTGQSVTHDDLAGAARADITDAEHLAVLSGLNITTLLRALPAFGHGPHHGRPPVRATRACRRCAARHGYTEPVPVHLPAHQRLCARHRIWLGATSQIDLAATPEIIYAHHRAARLARRHTTPRLIFAELNARQQVLSHDHGHFVLVQQRVTALCLTNPHLDVDHPDLIEAATYPETINTAAQAANQSP